MRVHETFGLFALNLLFLGAGLALLWGIRGFKTWGEVVRLSGLAYLVGISSLVVAGTELLVLGTSVRVPVVAGIAAGLAAIGVVAGLALGRPLPARARRPAREREPLTFVGYGAAALTALYLANFFRVARNQSQFVWTEWDVWNSWTTKAKSIYFTGGLDPDLYPQFFAASYPLFVPALSAMDFHFMGSPDTTLLHVQYWLLLVGFVGAIAGLLRPRVPLAVLWPVLLLLVVLPELATHALAPQADLTVDYLFAAGALCIALWILRREAWLLVPAGILLAGAMSTKREGYLFTAALTIATLAVTWRKSRSAWPPLLAVSVGAFLTAIPWQLWRNSHDIPDQLQDTSVSTALDRIGPAASSVAQIVFRYDLWLVTLPIGLAATAILLSRRRWQLAALYVTTVVLAWAGLVYALAADPNYTLGPTSDQNPIPRGSGGIALLTLAFLPLMLTAAISAPKQAQQDRPDGGGDRQTAHRGRARRRG